MGKDRSDRQHCPPNPDCGPTCTVGSGLIPPLGCGTNGAHEYGEVEHLWVTPFMGVLVPVHQLVAHSMYTGSSSLNSILVLLTQLIYELEIMRFLSE